MCKHLPKVILWSLNNLYLTIRRFSMLNSYIDICLNKDFLTWFYSVLSRLNIILVRIFKCLVNINKLANSTGETRCKYQLKSKEGSF